MELRAFAERVLRGATLVEKLSGEGPFSDQDAGPSRAFMRPTRPPAFAFPSGRIKDVLPGLSRLDRDEERGRLLHRFANHELLALEIMAATLLRFPDAPGAFRFGLAATMVEEQAHLALYLSRMVELGVQPGEIPVNDYFWRCLENISTPFDYTVRMALCFEQANLDFTLKYRDLFATVGDRPTAAILQRVYDDEIGHVRLGLHFFRAWKDPEKSDWDAFSAALPMPLSPARARSEPFDRSGRERVGFDPEFISKVELFSRSRGRPPVLHTFNPGFEYEVATGTAASDRVTTELWHDLSPLLMLVAAPDDVVECPTPPSEAWCRAWLAAGFSLSERVASVAELSGRKLGGWRPWGCSAVAATQVRGIFPESNPEVRRASSKVEQIAWRSRVIRALNAPWVVADQAEVVESVPAGLAALAKGWMLKAPYSTAGRDRVLPGGGDLALAERVRRLLDTHEVLRAEPFKKRVIDLSFHFDLTERGVRPRGICAFRTTPKGQFVGTHPGRWRDRLDGGLRDFFASRDRKLSRVQVALGDTLAECIAPLGVRGSVGIDAMIVDTEGVYQIDPFVELNPRLTMGRLSLALEKRIHPGVSATWDFLPVASLSGEPVRWMAEEREKHPMVLENGLIRRGVLATNDPATARRMLTVLRVG